MEYDIKIKTNKKINKNIQSNLNKQQLSVLNTKLINQQIIIAKDLKPEKDPL